MKKIEIKPEGNYEPSNCRFVTPRENCLNRRTPKNNTSGDRGVSYDKRYNKWGSRVSLNNKELHVGYFNSALEAAKAYDKVVMINNLPNKLNFEWGVYLQC